MRTRFRGLDLRDGVLRARRRRLGGVLPVLGLRRRGVASRGGGPPRGGRRGLAGPGADAGPGQRDRAGRRRREGPRDRARLRRLPDRQGEGGRARAVAGADDIARLEAVRDGARPRRAIRVDANGAWDVDTAVARIAAARPAAARAGVRRAALSPRVDELAARAPAHRTCRSPPTSRSAGRPTRCAVVARDAADVVVLKVQPLGGVRACLRSWPSGSACRSWSRRRWSRRSASPPGWRWRPRSPSCRTPAAWPPSQLLDDDVVDDPLLPVDGALPSVVRTRPGPARRGGRGRRETAGALGRPGSALAGSSQDGGRDAAVLIPTRRPRRPGAGRRAGAPASRTSCWPRARGRAAGVRAGDAASDARPVGSPACACTCGSTSGPPAFLAPRAGRARRRPGPGPAARPRDPSPGHDLRHGGRQPAPRRARGAPERRARSSLLTADRPHELRGTGANQTTDQVGIYGGAVRLRRRRGRPGRPPARPAAYARTSARAVAAAHGRRTGDPGPVHLNLALREPLVPGDGPVAGAVDRRDHARAARHVVPASHHRCLADGRRRCARRRVATVLVAGDGAGAATPAGSPRRRAGPLLAGPRPGRAAGPTRIAAYRLVLAGTRCCEELAGESTSPAGHPFRPVRRLLHPAGRGGHSRRARGRAWPDAARNASESCSTAGDAAGADARARRVADASRR